MGWRATAFHAPAEAVDAALIASATLLGLAGTPHCAAMCAAPCAAASGQRRAGIWAFQAARLAGYAAAGAVVAGSVGALAVWSQWSPALRPVWAAVHAAILVLGLWMLWHGRQPGWMAGIGRAPAASTSAAPPSGWLPMRGPLRAAAAGGLWVAWPCGLLQSALLVASLAGSAAAGAGVMTGFALASSAGLVAAPWVWRRLHPRGGSSLAHAGTERALVRGAGALLALGSAFALGHGVWHQVAVYCGWA